MMYVLLSLFTAIILLLHIFFTKKFNYWKKRNVPFAKPLPFVGNYGKLIFLKEFSGKIAQKLCQQFPNEPYFGTFYGTEPALVVQEPEILKHVFTKDFYYFSGREVVDYTHKELVTRNMFFGAGDDWKVMRRNLSGMFSTAKMKKMFHLIQKCNEIFEEMLEREVSISDVLNAGSITSRYTMACICSCVFGVDANTMGNDEANTFVVMGEEIFLSTNIRGLQLIGRAMWPSIFYGLGFKLFPQSISKFFQQLLTVVFEHRQYQPSQRNDFVDQLLSLTKQEYLYVDSLNNAKTGGKEQARVKVDDDLLVGQCILFFAAGFETSATTFCFILYEFAKNLEAQERATREVHEYLRRQKGILDYSCVNELPYLEACVYETLRLYPILGLLTREVTDDYTFPTGLKVERGLRVHIPVYHLHHDPRNFPDPEKYQPDRFLPGAVHEIKPYTYFPFGEGPRICIGKSFAKMQILSGLVTFLKKYRVEMAEDTPLDIKLEPRAMATRATEKIKLKLINRK